MNKRAIVPVLAACSLLSGCASLYGTFGKNSESIGKPPVSESWVYTGVKTDGMALGYSLFCIGGGHGCGKGANLLFLATPLMVADIPLSFVADTFLLPYTLHKQRKLEAEAPGQEHVQNQ